MIGFFVKHKKTRGVITVFLTLMYLSLYLLIGVFVDGGRVRMAQTVIEDVQQVATENTMSQYNRGLYEYYGLLGVSNYDINEISRDVKAQIEESVGIKIPNSTVKSFVLDTATAIDAAIDNVDMLKKQNNGIAENTIEYAKKIQSEISGSHKVFNPYGLEDIEATASYISLNNVDAIRAQMRDETRYKALMLPTVSFFKTAEQLMKVSNGINTMSNIANKATSTSEIGKQYKIYTAGLNKFTGTYKNQLLKSIYEIDFNNIKSLKLKTQDKVQNSPSLLSKLFNFFSGKKGTEETEEIENDNQSDFYSDIETNVRLDETSKDNVEDTTGLKRALDVNFNELYKFCKPFDESSGWPGPVYKTVGEGENAHEVYDKEAHRAEVRAEGESRASEYVGRINTIIDKLNNTRIDLGIAMSELNKYLNDVSSLVADYNADLSEAAKKNDEESISLYGHFIEVYLKQWYDGSEQRKILSNIDGLLGDALPYLRFASDDANSTVDQIVREVNSGWHHPNSNSTLHDNRNNNIQYFHKKMLDIADEMNKYQEQADGETQSSHVFQLIKAITENSNNQKDEDKKLFDVLSDCGKIIEYEHKEENTIFNYDEYLKLSEKENTEDKDYIKFDDSDTDEFQKKHIHDEVGAIFSKASDLVSNLTSSMFDNLYDEMYILNNCRDFVHTYQYKDKGMDEWSDDKQKEEKVDIIFNKKFVHDLHETNYLSDTRLNDLQVTPAEIEYILFGLPNTKEDVVAMYTSIFTLRLALNYIAVFTSPAASEVSGLAAASFIAAPVVMAAAPLIYAIPQTGIEMKKIMGCQRVNFWNGGPNLHLYNPYATIIKDEASEAVDKLADTLDEVTNTAKMKGTEELLSDVIENNDPYDANIDAAVTTLKVLINNDKYKAFEVGDYVNEKLQKGIIRDSTNAITNENNGPQAGYSDYLLIFLFLNGMAKQKQIERLQNVIQTNMQIEQKDFELKNTYSQIAVDVKSKVKYIFMTQSIMKKTFSNAIKDDYSTFPIRTKTAFAY